MLVTTAVTLALIGFVVSMLAELARQDGLKIVAALQGRSWAAHSTISALPITIRLSPRYMAAEPARPALRAAA